MKTTVELPEELLREAQDLARKERTTLRELIETGLRLAIARGSEESTFTLADASVGGRGLQPAFRDAGWDQVRDAIYARPA